MPLGVAPTRQQLRSWRGHPLAAAAIRLVTFTTPISLESAADQAIAATIGVVNVMIIELLLRHGATADDMDANGKTVRVAAASDWIRELLT